MEFTYLITFNDNPICLCNKINILIKLKEMSILRHYSEYTIYLINNTGEIYSSRRVKMYYEEEEKIFKYFLDDILVDESSFQSIISIYAKKN